MFDNPYHTKDLSNYTFLVTGAAGFIGSNLVQYLLNHKAGKVLALDNLETGFIKNLESFLKKTSFAFLRADITDLDACRKACKGVDYVFHQAALGSVPRSIKDPIATNKANIDGFLNILVAGKENGVKRLVYAASSSTYGDSKTLPKIEENIGKPLSPYAVTKYVNELYADVFGKTYGFESIGLRYFNVFGPNQSPSGAYAAVIPKFIDAILNERSPLIDGDGNQTRDFTFIENVIQANIKAAFTENCLAINQVYNIAVGERCSINTLFDTLLELSGKKITPVFKEARPGDVKDSLADISKAQELIGYEPTVRFKEGLKETLLWFKNNFYKTQLES